MSKLDSEIPVYVTLRVHLTFRVDPQGDLICP